MDDSGITWSDLRPYVSVRMIIAAAITFIVTVWMFTWLFVELPALRVSVFSVAVGVVKSLVGFHVHLTDFYPTLESGSGSSDGGPPLYFQLPLSAGGLMFARFFFRVIPTHAYREEVAFRGESQKHGPGQRLRACVTFGLLHFYNLVYPLALCITLIVGGGVLLVSYLRGYRKTGSESDAIYRSTALHSIYNVFAVAFMAAWLLYILWV